MEFFSALGGSALLALWYPGLFKETSVVGESMVFILTMFIFSAIKIVFA